MKDFLIIKIVITGIILLQVRRMNKLTPFIIHESRKHGLLFNERTTVLTRADELQVLQYHLGIENAAKEVCIFGPRTDVFVKQAEIIYTSDFF